MQHILNISTNSKYDMVDITEEVESIVAKSGIKEGLCNLYTSHATAAITINENADPNVPNDIIKALSNMVPEGKWLHDKIDNNAAAHIKSSIIGPSATIPVNSNKLMLGRWQNIFLCDFDGPRPERKIVVTIIGK